jgi:hypothetical protein
MPEWNSAAKVLLEKGRLLRVAHPSEVHKQGRMNVT